MAGARKRAAQVQHLREKALELAASGEYGEAIGRYEKLIDIDPEEAEWSRRAVDCAWHLKDHQKRLKFSALAGKVYAETGTCSRQLPCARSRFLKPLRLPGFVG